MRVGLSTTAIFGNLGGYIFRNFRDTANNYYMTICYPLSACDWWQNEWPRMTLSGYFMPKSIFGHHFSTQIFWLSKIIAWKVTNINSCYKRQKCRSMTLVSGKIHCKSFVDIPKHFSDCCHQTGVGWLKSTNLQFSQYYIFVSFGHNVDFVVQYDNNPFWISADTNKDDLEWPWMTNWS